MSKRRKKDKPATEGPFTGIYNWGGMCNAISTSPPVLTVEQRLERLEKQAVKFNNGYYIGSEPPTLVERVDWLFKYFSLEFKTYPGIPPETVLRKKWWWE